jgi:hypothetical protein
VLSFTWQNFKLQKAQVQVQRKTVDPGYSKHTRKREDRHHAFTDHTLRENSSVQPSSMVQLVLMSLLGLCGDRYAAMSVFSFLNPALDFPWVRQVCKRFSQLIPRVTMTRVILPDLFCNGSLGDKFTLWSELIPCLGEKLVQIELHFAWADQGWGNRKSCLSLKLIRQGVLVAEDSFAGLAPHEPQEFQCVLHSSPVILLSEPGDSIEMWRFAGDGGGHSLKVQNCTCQMLTAQDSPMASWESYKKAQKGNDSEEKVLEIEGPSVETGGIHTWKDYDLYLRLKPYPLDTAKISRIAFSGNWSFSSTIHNIDPRFVLRLRRGEDYIEEETLISASGDFGETPFDAVAKDDGVVLKSATKGDFLEIWRYIGPEYLRIRYLKADDIMVRIEFK